MAIDPNIPLQGRNVNLAGVLQRSLQTMAMVSGLRSQGQKREQVDMQNRAQAMKGALAITRDINNIYDATAQQELAPGTPGQEGMGMFSSPQAKAMAEANRAYQERLPQLMSALGVDADGLEESGIPRVYNRERMKVLEQMFGQEDIKLQAMTKPPPGYRLAETGAGGRPELVAIPGGPGELAQKRERRSQAENLAARWDKNTETFKTSSEALGLVTAGLSQRQGYGDMVAVYGAVGLLDPKGSVREGDTLTIENAPGFTAKMRNKFNSWIGEGQLTDKSRVELLEAVQAGYLKRLKGYKGILKTFEGRAERGKLNRDDVITDWSAGVMEDADAAMKLLRGSIPKGGVTGTPGTATPEQKAVLTRYASTADVDQAVADGKLKSGDQFIDNDGKVRSVR